MFKSPLRKYTLLWVLWAMLASLSACQSNPPQNPVEVTVTATTEIPSATSPPPTGTATPTPEETQSPPQQTETPSPTATPTDTPTPTPRGALTWEQEERLYQVSLQFLAENERDATIVVRDQIDYLPGVGEHPSLVCGPLSAVILRDAGLLPPDTNLHGFWLLDPRSRTSQQVLEKYFPIERYQWYHFDTGTHKFDFNAFPLLPGDFLYLYAGPNGTFEHIITVTHVDEQGRAYTVSNLATQDGFVIRELMLYDPNDPGVGQFYDWMNWELNRRLGRTGDGGFDLWRPIAPVKDYTVP